MATSTTINSKLLCMLDQLQPDKNYFDTTIDKENQYRHNEGDAESSVGFCPFVAYEDGYIWPNLYDELDAMIFSNTLVYPYSELHRFQRAGVALFGPELSLPLTCKKIVKSYTANRQLVEACGLNKALNSMILATADDREAVAEQERMMIEEADLRQLDFQSSKIDDESSDVLTVSVGDDSSTSTTFISSEDAWGSDPIDNSKVLAFEDRFEEKGFVYMVQLDPCQRRLVFAFRGSVTDSDWVTGLQGTMESIPDPNRQRCTALASHVHIHSSFRKSLYEREERDDVSVLQSIWKDHLYPLTQKYHGYKLYVTGYSAGAAIATLFAFETASQLDDLVPKPVTLVSFGSPAVGDDNFLRSFQYLEKLGKLRAVRVVNRNDPIPPSPKINDTFSPFKHVGMTLKLNGEDDCDLSYPTVNASASSCNTDIFHGLVDGWDQVIRSAFHGEDAMKTTMPEHSLREYNLRCLLNRPSLQSIALHDLYTKRHLVGSLVPEV